MLKPFDVIIFKVKFKPNTYFEKKFDDISMLKPFDVIIFEVKFKPNTYFEKKFDVWYFQW